MAIQSSPLQAFRSGPSAHSEGPNAHGPTEDLGRQMREYGSALGDTPQDPDAPEQLPGITSGPAPKPWGLDRDQPLYKAPTSGSGFVDTLSRPGGRLSGSDPYVDPGMSRQPPAEFGGNIGPWRLQQRDWNI
jgi:hypothetical protein